MDHVRSQFSDKNLTHFYDQVQVPVYNQVWDRVKSGIELNLKSGTKNIMEFDDRFYEAN